MGFRELHELAHHGFVDLPMVLEAELTRAQAHGRAETDGWDPHPGGGWRLPGHEPTGRFHLTAAVRQTGPDAVADRHSALALNGLVSSFPTRPQVLLPHECRSRNVDGVDIRRTRRLLASHVEVVDRIPTVTVPRALANLAAQLQTSALRSLALAAQRSDLASPHELEAVMVDLPSNMPGRGRLRQVVEDLRADGSESGLEFTARRRMGDAGLTPDPDQPTVLVAGVRRRIDIAWLPLRVGVECQGYGAHTGAAALDQDAGRLNALAAEADWTILQLTPQMLHETWPAFLDNLRRCLLRRAVAFGLPAPAGTSAG